MRRSRSDEVSGRPLGTFGYFFGEALRRLWISRRNSFAAIAMIAVALFILGSFLLVSENLGRAIDVQRGESRMVVYLADDATPEEIEAIRGYLESHPRLARNEFVTPSMAMERFKASFPNLASVVDELESNPFPSSFDVKVDEGVISQKAFFDEIGALRRMPGVDDLQLDWEWMAKLRGLVRTIRLAGIAVGGLLAVAAAFMIANVIRLTMVLYREEIGIMRLVGATETIIRGPFLVEGFLQGLIGGVLSVALLAAAWYGTRELASPANAIIRDVVLARFLSPIPVGALVAAGIVAGLTGSWLAVRETSAEAAVTM